MHKNKTKQNNQEIRLRQQYAKKAKKLAKVLIAKLNGFNYANNWFIEDLPHK